MELKKLFSIVLFGLSICLFSSFSIAEDATPVGPVVFFPEPRYAFEQALEGTELVHDFVIMNKGDSTLDVQRVKSGWGCTTVSYSRQVPAGGEGKISIRVNTNGYAGKTLHKTMTVQTNDEKNPIAQLEISGQIEKFAAILPESVKLLGPSGKPIAGEVKIIPQKKYPFSITEVKALDGKNILLKLEEVTSGPEKGYLLRIENIKKDQGRYRDTIVLKTTSEIKPELEIRVFGNVSGPNSVLPVQGKTETLVSIIPAMVKLSGPLGKPIVKEVRIVPKEKNPFSITEARALEGKNVAFKLEELKGPNEKGYLLRIENTKKDQGRYRDTIVLKTTSEIKPELKIPVFGDIFDPKTGAPLQGNQNLQKFFDAIKNQQSKNPQSGEGQVQQKSPSVDGQNFFEQLIKQNQERQKNSATEQ